MNSNSSANLEINSLKSKTSQTQKKNKKSKKYFEVITNFFLCRGCNTRFTF